MSTIKLEIEVSAENAQLVADFLSKVGEITKKSVGFKSAETEKIEVVDAEEVKAPAAKTPTPRPSRAKAKPEPVVEPVEDEDDDFGDDTDESDEDEATITADDLRELQATKIAKHKEALKAEYKRLGAGGISTLPEEHYAAMHAFMSKLK